MTAPCGASPTSGFVPGAARTRVAHAERRSGRAQGARIHPAKGDDAPRTTQNRIWASARTEPGQTAVRPNRWRPVRTEPWRRTMASALMRAGAPGGDALLRRGHRHDHRGPAQEHQDRGAGDRAASGGGTQHRGRARQRSAGGPAVAAGRVLPRNLRAVPAEHAGHRYPGHGRLPDPAGAAPARCRRFFWPPCSP